MFEVVILGFILIINSADVDCSSNGIPVMKDKLVRSHDMELIKLYLEEFRLDILSMKSQLSRMSRNSKHVRTTLKELKSAKCIGKEIGENDFIQFYRNDKNNNIIYLFYVTKLGFSLYTFSFFFKSLLFYFNKHQ